MERSLARVLEAYLLVISGMASSIIYLLYITAAVIGGMVTTLAYGFLGESVLSHLISSLSFITAFLVATYSSFVVERLGHFLMEAEGRELTRGLKVAMILNWVIPFGALSPLLFISLWRPEQTYCIYISVSLALGNLGLFLLEMKYGSRVDLRPLFVTAYLIITAPLYLPLTGELVYSMLTFNLAFSYFFVAVWYLISAWRGVEGILHAARGQGEANNREG